MEFIVRTPGAPDADRIAEVHVSTWRETYGHLLDSAFFDEALLAQRRAMWREILGKPRADWAIRVADAGGTIIGFAFSSPVANLPDGTNELRQLHSIYVDQRHHGTGAGQALLDATLGSTPATLWVEKGNGRAQAFYRKNGFELDGTEKNDPHLPPLVEVRMVR
jgi:ribosomal protein S18 acetylase RimI-like enzyme